ncbi:GT28 [Ectocarpus sp. CCAP 1310/34]|nr:GT28 [Ectocarpus sp. CCAP 1310/34]
MSPTLFKIYINDLIRAVEAVRQGVQVGGKSVSGLMFADDFVGVSETPEGLQEQIDAAVGYTRKWRLSANVGKCAVVVCNEDKKNPVEFKWKWGEEELPVVDRSVSGLMFADDFVGVSETPEGLQEQIDAAVGYTRKWRLSANVGKCAVVVYNSEKTIAVIGDRWWAQEALEDGDKMCKKFLCSLWQKRGFGAYSKNPTEIGATVARWLKNPELLQKMKDCALQAARPRASYDIAREIADMLFLDADGGGHGEPEAVVANSGGWAGAMHTAMGGGGAPQNGLEQEQQAIMETAGRSGWEGGGGGGGGGERAPERKKVPVG